MTNFKRFSELATRFMASLRPKQNKTTTTTTEEGVIRMSVSGGGAKEQGKVHGQI